MPTCQFTNSGHGASLSDLARPNIFLTHEMFLFDAVEDTPGQQHQHCQCGDHDDDDVVVLQSAFWSRRQRCAPRGCCWWWVRHWKGIATQHRNRPSALTLPRAASPGRGDLAASPRSFSSSSFLDLFPTPAPDERWGHRQKALGTRTGGSVGDVNLTISRECVRLQRSSLWRIMQ